MYSDLLGFGNLVASANGTFESPVGSVALKRVEALRSAFFKNTNHFPGSTKFFQLNDLVIASLDVSMEFGAMTIDPRSTFSKPLNAEQSATLLSFLSAVGKFHQDVLNTEELNHLGQGCRTFIVLGQRWAVSEMPPRTNLADIPELQANMALAEAYTADSIGSAGGFQHSPWDRLYVNDHFWQSLVSASAPLARSHSTIPHNRLQQLDGLGIPNSGAKFPDNLSRNSPIKVKIFHREREFRSLMSHWVCQI